MVSKRIVYALVFFTSLVFEWQAFAASPPWYYYWNLVDHTVGKSPCVEVLDLEFPPEERPYSKDNPIVIPVKVCDAKLAQNLVAFLKPSFYEGLIIEVRTAEGVVKEESLSWSLDDVITHFRDTFEANPLFSKVGPSMFGAAATFKADVVQFFCDDISVPSGFCHFLVAEAFAIVLKENVSQTSLVFTTAIK